MATCTWTRCILWIAWETGLFRPTPPVPVERLPDEVRDTHNRVYVTSVIQVPSEPSRCIRIDDPQRLYLTEGFIPTHNSVVIQSLIAGSLARGAELVVIDLPAKKVDYLWCQSFCREGGFGADSLAGNVTSLAMAYDEGLRRAELMGKHGVTKWSDLPVQSGIRPIVIVCDEVTGLFQLEDVAKGLPKDHPLVAKPTQNNLMRATIKSYISRIAAEMRFAGLHICLATQVASTTTGVPTSIRLNLGTSLLLGVRATANNRRLALSDVSSVPRGAGSQSVDCCVPMGLAHLRKVICSCSQQSRRPPACLGRLVSVGQPAPDNTGPRVDMGSGRGR